VERVCVTGAGGFIGHHMVSFLKEQGHWVRGVDIKAPEFEATRADDFLVRDLRSLDACIEATKGVDSVYAMAADMGGMGYISANHARIVHNNTLISLSTLEAARRNDVGRYLYTSSACVYPVHLQLTTDVPPLREEDAYPANPQDGYGWEKLYGERLCEYYAEEYGMVTRIPRFHNIYGPLGTYEGGREKAPAAMCRKVALAPPDGMIEIWGDGEQTRSFCYIDDCVEGIYRLMQSDHSTPINLGSEEMVSINELAEIVMHVAEKPGLRIVHVDGPQGVRGRNSDNTLLRKVLRWEPTTPLAVGLESTYRWVEGRVVSD
jgi:GDP-D-mannose 3', 5'-epimerase